MTSISFFSQTVARVPGGGIKGLNLKGAIFLPTVKIAHIWQRGQMLSGNLVFKGFSWPQRALRMRRKHKVN